MVVRFWGVRGSLPAPGPATVRYGGNTPCISIDVDAENTLILDAGSGIRELGEVLVDQPKHLFLLLSHIHWDHIQGFPFFAPIYVPGQEITILNNRSPDWIARLFAQMDGSYFPVRFEHLASKINIAFQHVRPFLAPLGIEAQSIEANHPGGCLGYRITQNGRSVVYLSDNELDPPDKPTTRFDQFVAFCQHADLLIHDAQYTAADLPEKRGWGHSVVERVCDLAAGAEVKQLALFHHDPARMDHEVEAIEKAAQVYLQRAAAQVECFAAYEGFTCWL